MTLDDVQYIIQQGEGLKIEFKEAKDAVPKSFYESVVSFSNTDGGTILLGVSDTSKVLGIDSSARVKLQKDIVTALNTRDCINPPLYIQPYFVRHPHGEIMVIQIPASSQVHDHAGRIYSREYTSALSTELIITGNEVTITNPNKPLFHGPIDPRGFNPYPKNPNIRKFFTAFGWTDEIGSGIRNTSRYLPLYSDGAQLVFWENDTFKTDIPLRLITLAKFFQPLHKWLEFPDEVMDHIEKGLSKIALPANLVGASWPEVILHLVPSWHQKGTQLYPLSWPDNQPHTNIHIESIPSYHQNCTQLLTKKARYLISILTLSTEPMAIKDLMRFIDYKNEKSFRDSYIKPLHETGLIVLTNPDKPTSPNNKYTITDSGKAFLGGL